MQHKSQQGIDIAEDVAHCIEVSLSWLSLAEKATIVPLCRMSWMTFCAMVLLSCLLMLLLLASRHTKLGPAQTTKVSLQPLCVYAALSCIMTVQLSASVCGSVE